MPSPTYCAVCGGKIVYPLSHFLYGTNLCFKHGRPFLRLPQKLLCKVGSHHWVFLHAEVSRYKVSYYYACRRCFKLMHSHCTQAPIILYVVLLVKCRLLLKAQKDYVAADKIKYYLESHGVKLEDSGGRTIFHGRR